EFVDSRTVRASEYSQSAPVKARPRIEAFDVIFLARSRFDVSARDSQDVRGERGTYRAPLHFKRQVSRRDTQVLDDVAGCGNREGCLAVARVRRESPNPSNPADPSVQFGKAGCQTTHPGFGGSFEQLLIQMEVSSHTSRRPFVTHDPSSWDSLAPLFSLKSQLSSITKVPSSRASATSSMTTNSARA